MKKQFTIFTIIAMASAASVALAHDGHDHPKETAAAKTEAKHDHGKEKTPNGGRLIHTVTPHAEFLVTAERRVEIRFLEEGKVIAPAGQQVTVVTGSRAEPVRIAFAEEEGKLVSAEALPEGSELPIVLQIKGKGESKAVTERFTLNLAPCPTCEHSEYACTCDHAGKHDPGDGHGHPH